MRFGENLEGIFEAYGRNLEDVTEILKQLKVSWDLWTRVIRLGSYKQLIKCFHLGTHLNFFKIHSN